MIRRRRPQRLRIRAYVPRRPYVDREPAVSRSTARHSDCARYDARHVDQRAGRSGEPGHSTGEPADQQIRVVDSDTTIAPVTSTNGRPSGEPRHDRRSPISMIRRRRPQRLRHSDTTIAPVTSTSEPAAQANQVTTGDPTDQHDSTAPTTAIAAFGYDHRARHVDRRAGRSGEPGHDRRYDRSA